MKTSDQRADPSPRRRSLRRPSTATGAAPAPAREALQLPAAARREQGLRKAQPAPSRQWPRLRPPARQGVATAEVQNPLSWQPSPAYRAEPKAFDRCSCAQLRRQHLNKARYPREIWAADQQRRGSSQNSCLWPIRQTGCVRSAFHRDGTASPRRPPRHPQLARADRSIAARWRPR